MTIYTHNYIYVILTLIFPSQNTPFFKIIIVQVYKSDSLFKEKSCSICLKYIIAVCHYVTKVR